MILSEDCDFERINSIAIENKFKLNLVHQKKVLWETNCIFRSD